MKYTTLKENGLRHYYEKIRPYTVQLEPYIMLSIAIFLIFAVLGYTAPVLYEEQIRELMRSVLEMFSALLELSPFRLMLTIFANNAVAVAIVMFGGLLFGLGTLYMLSVNGFLVGILSFFILSEGIGASSLAAGLLPHGVIELPVIWIAGGVGLLAGRRMIERVFVKKQFNIREAINEMIIIFLILLIPLFLASILEVYLTPLVLEAFAPTEGLPVSGL